MTDFVNHYNTVRLSSATIYVAPADKLQGRDQQILQNGMPNWKPPGKQGDRNGEPESVAKAMGRHKAIPSSGRAQTQGLNEFQLVTNSRRFHFQLK